ncbi:unnamed protein product [Chironomus riparius]|uniref:C2H2-type domain-containing protein n=1 Tax=Chironomus riparius TaxID=315576 RepID=A0A9N9S4P2_9DIPT|nr:unnamed protein product [Chironomus riparius]
MEPPKIQQRSSTSSKISENLAILKELNIKMEADDQFNGQALLDYNISSPCPSQMTQHVNYNLNSNPVNPQMLRPNYRNYHNNPMPIGNLQHPESQNIQPESHQNGAVPTIRSRLLAIRQSLGKIKREDEIEPKDPDCMSNSRFSHASNQLPARVYSPHENIQNYNPNTVFNPLEYSGSSMMRPASVINQYPPTYPRLYPRPYLNPYPLNRLQMHHSNIQHQASHFIVPTSNSFVRATSAGAQSHQFSSNLNSVHTFSSHAIPQTITSNNLNEIAMNSRESEIIDLTESDGGAMEERRSNLARFQPNFRGTTSNGMSMRTVNVLPNQEQHNRRVIIYPAAGCSANHQTYSYCRHKTPQNNILIDITDQSVPITHQTPQNSAEASDSSSLIPIRSVLTNLVSVSSLFKVKFYTTKLRCSAVKYDKATIKYCQNYYAIAKKMFEKCEICEGYNKNHRIDCHHKNIDLDVLMTFGIYYCDYDGRIIRHKGDFIHHMKSHIIVKCQECGSKIKESGLAIHIKFNHQDDGEYKCKLCPKVFNNKHRLKRHSEAHDMKFECQSCNRKFSKKGRLTEHFNAYHNDDRKAQ